MSSLCSKRVNSLPNDTFLDCAKLKAFADDKLNLAKKLKLDLERVEKIERKGKCWLPAFSVTSIFPFLSIFFKRHIFEGRQRSGLCGKDK